MKCFLPLLFLTAGVAFGQTRHDLTMMVDGVERQCIVVRPGGAAPADGYPVVFMFHGTSGDGERFYNISGWKEKGQAETFVTVFPSSLRYCFKDDDDTTKEVSTTKWNCGEAQARKCAGVVMKDDIAFVRAIVDTVKHMLPIDGRRIYASGFSNGGCFTSKLAVEMSDVFAAVAAAAGPMSVSDSSAPARPVPFAFTIGNDDPKLIASIGRSCPFNDSCRLILNGMIQRYRGVFNLASTFERDSTALALVYRYTAPAASGIPASRLLFGVMKGLTHEYPNGSNYPIAAANYLWTFFNQFSLPAAVPAVSNGAAAVYPNPTSDYLVVSGTEGRITLTLTSTLGGRVFTTEATGGERIELPRLAPGAYLAAIDTPRGRTTKVVVIE